VRQRGIGDVDFALNISNNAPVRMRRKKNLHNAQPGLSSHGRKHVRKLRDLIQILSNWFWHISIILEIWFMSTGKVVADKSVVKEQAGEAGACNQNRLGDFPAEQNH